MILRSATASLALFLFLCLMLTAGKTVTAGECLHCPKIEFERIKPPRIKCHRVCPKSISCGAPEHFGYYPTCWTAWPFPPDYSHCPCPPAIAAVPSAPRGAPAAKDQLPSPRTLPEPTEPKTTEPKTTEPKTTEPGLP